MSVLDVLLDEALQRTPFGDVHAQWADTLIALGDASFAARTIEGWLGGTRGVGRCELLCALARARIASGLSADAIVAEAQALADAEWGEAERAWTALAKTFLCAGELGLALDAWTHPDNAYSFPERDAVTATAVALRRAGRWGGLDRLLRHVGPGHDQAVILDAVMGDALDRQELGPALQALWWIPESLREDALLGAVRGAVEGGLPAVGWAVEALWDGLEAGEASRARARARLGDSSGTRALLAPLLVAWISPACTPSPEAVRHAAVALVLIGDADGALWCLDRLEGVRVVLRALREAVEVAAVPEPLMQFALDRWPGDVHVLRVIGALEAAGGALRQGRARLRSAADQADTLADHYQRRLALQEIAHAQVEAGDLDAALVTAARLTRRRFGHEHIAAAAVRQAAAGNVEGAAVLLKKLPAGRLRIQAACAALQRAALLEPAPESRGEHPMHAMISTDVEG